MFAAVVAGEGAVSVNNSYYFARLLTSDKPEDKEVVKNLAIMFPDQVSLAAVGKNTPEALKVMDRAGWK